MTAEEKNAMWIGGLSALGSMTKVTEESIWGINAPIKKKLKKESSLSISPRQTIRLLLIYRGNSPFTSDYKY